MLDREDLKEIDMCEENSTGKRRLGKDEYFVEIAKIVARRSTCLRRDVGTVLVKDSHSQQIFNYIRL